MDTHHQQEDGEWGTAYPGPRKDLAANRHEGVGLPSAVENFTIAFDKTASAARCGWIGRRHGHPWKFRGCSMLEKFLVIIFTFSQTSDSEEGLLPFSRKRVARLRSKAAKAIQNEKRRAG